LNKWITEKEFIGKLKDGMSFFIGGFMACGTAERLIDFVLESGVKDLTVICNDAGYPGAGTARLIEQNRVKKLIASHIGLNPEAGRRMSNGELEVELVPQGTLAERIRAHGYGLGGVLTPTGVNTIVEANKKTITINEKKYLIEEPLGADIALIKAHKSDKLGNLVFRKTERNFNPVMATAAKNVFVWVDEVVEELDPEIIVTPHVFSHYLLTGGAK